MKTIKLFLGFTLLFILTVILSSLTDVITAGGISTAMGGSLAVRDRGIFKALQTKYEKRIVSPGFLRIEEVITNSKSVYSFDIKKNGNESSTELKLDRNDIFKITDIGIFLISRTTAEPGREVLQTYPNETAFPVVAGFTPSDMETIYNGAFQLKIGNVVNVEALSMQEFRYVPETQQSGVANKSQLALRDATYKLGSLLNIQGTMDVKMEISIPTFAGIEIGAITAGTDHRLVMMPFGYLIKSAAKRY